ncbi:MAG: acyltransferase [Bacteroidetes bacterium]|nr:acyltransferase [Bacteroidota bacterium]
MKNQHSILKSIWRTNLKTIYFNFKYLPWQQAIRFPFWISSNTYLRKTKGTITINAPLSNGMISIGYGDIGIFDNKKSRSIWDVAGKVVFEGAAEIGHGSKISVGASGELFLGDKFALTAESTIIAYKKIVFGNNCLLSWDILLMDTDLHSIKNADAEILNPDAEIIIGNSVWIGCRSLILKGAVIPDGSVIAANSFVNKKLSGPNQLFGKQPLSSIAQNIFWQQ